RHERRGRQPSTSFARAFEIAGRVPVNGRAISAVSGRKRGSTSLSGSPTEGASARTDSTTGPAKGRSIAKRKAAALARTSHELYGKNRVSSRPPVRRTSSSSSGAAIHGGRSTTVSIPHFAVYERAIASPTSLDRP